jgi:tetratricopeptide (TPR) repeat protein
MDEQETRTLLRFAAEAGRGLRGMNASAWRDRIERRSLDLEAALGWLLDHGQASDALELASTLSEFLRITGRVATARRWLDRALAAAPDDPRRAVGLYEDGMLAFWQGADEEACQLHGRSLQLARRLGDRATVALALCGLARVALREDLDWAQALCEEALATVEGTGDRQGRANALHVLGVAAQMRGDLARADRLAREALRIGARRGDQWLVPYVLNGLAAVAVEVGAPERAATLLGSAAAMVERQGNAWPPDEAPHFQRSRAAAARALGPDQFERAWSAGRRLALAEAVSYALAPLPVGAGVACSAAQSPQ